MRQALFCSHRWESGDPERLSSSPKVTQPGAHKGGTEARASLALLQAQMHMDGGLLLPSCSPGICTISARGSNEADGERMSGRQGRGSSSVLGLGLDLGSDTDQLGDCIRDCPAPSQHLLLPERPWAWWP